MSNLDKYYQSVMPQNNGGGQGAGSPSFSSAGLGNYYNQILQSGDSYRAAGAQQRDEQLLRLAQEAADRSAQQAAQQPQANGIFTKPKVTTNRWAGRDELLKELNEIDTYSGYITDPEEGIRSEQRRREILQQLEQGDLKAGNGNRSYGEVDRARNIFTGASKDYGSGIANFFGTASRALNTLADKMPDSGIENYDLMASPLAETNTKEYGMQRADRMQATADRLGEGAQKDLESAKFGLSKFGQAGVDIATNVIQMGFDAGIGAITGGGALAPMFVRSAGSSAREARMEGASLGQQVAYGTVKGGIEVLTEKMFDGVAKIYGAGAADELVERAIGRFAKSDTGRTFLRLLSNGAGEGIEEMVSDILSPIAEAIYKDESIGQLYRQLDMAEILYDGLIGAAIGALGGGTSIISGQNAEANAELRAAEAGTSVRVNVNNAWDVLTGRATPEQVQAREQAARERAGLSQEQVQEAQSSTAQTTQFRRQLVDGFLSDLQQGEELDDSQADILRSGYETSGMSPSEYAAAVHAAYGYGKRGIALDKAQRDASREQANGELGLSQDVTQSVAFRNAWQIGRQKRLYTSNIEAGSVQDTLDASMSALGEQRQAAMAVYEQGQNPEEFAAEMVRAVQMASYGENIEAVAADDRDTRGAQLDILTERQIQAAKTIGADLRAARMTKAQNDTLFESIRSEAQRILDAENPEIGELNAAIADAQDYLKQKDAELQEASAALSAIAGDTITVTATGDVQTPAGMQAPKSEAYNQALARVQKIAEEIGYTQEAVQQLTKERNEAREKNPGKRKEGTVTFGRITYKDGSATPAIEEHRLNQRQQNIVNATRKLADAVNLDFVFFYGSKGDAVNLQGGEYNPTSDTIYININAGIGTIRKYIAMGSISHELTHFIQKYAPEDYQVLKDFVIKKIMEKSPAEFNRMVRNYQNMKAYQEDLGNGQYRIRSFDYIADEMVANACMKMMENSQAIREFASENLTVAEKINNVIQQFIDRIKAAFAEVDPNDNMMLYKEMQLLQGEMDQIQRLWDAALRVAMRNYNAAQVVRSAMPATENAAQESGEVRHMAWDNGDIKRTFIPFSDTDTRGREQNSKRDSLIARGKIVKIPNEAVQAMLGKTDWNDIKKAREAIKMILKERLGNDSVHFTYDGAILTAYMTAAGRDHTAGGKPDAQRGAIYDKVRDLIANSEYIYSAQHDIHSIAGQSMPAETEWDSFEAVAELDGEYVPIIFSVITNDLDVRSKIYSAFEDRKSAVSRGAGLNQVGHPSYGVSTLDPIIEDAEQSVNENRNQTMGEDSTGRQLTEAQQEFFADSAITDNQGRLKLMYRGGNGDFTVFDRKKSRPSNLYGRGFYFTDSKTHAERYGRARAFYLNIKNPLKAGSRNITDKQLRAFLKAVEADEDYGLENYGYGATVQSVMKSLKGKDDFGVLQDINATAIGDFVAAVELFNEINGTNYDGIVADTETVAFRSNQIKDILNLNPTEDADIRFQMMGEVEETDKLIAVHNKTMSGLRRMIERGGVPYPSLAIKKAGSGHNHYGPVSIVFGKNSIDPQANRRNRIYGGDAWTPTEPRTEYDVNGKVLGKARELVESLVGDKEIYNSLAGYLDADNIATELKDSGGDVFNALKRFAVLKYAYMRQQGQEPALPRIDETLDSFHKYSNEQLLTLFNELSEDEILNAEQSDMEYRRRVADIFNRELQRKIAEAEERAAKAKGDVARRVNLRIKMLKSMLVSPGEISTDVVRNALIKYRNNGNQVKQILDKSAIKTVLRDNEEIENDSGYQKWIRETFAGLVKDSGLRNGKDPFFPDGRRRTFKQTHIPATLENITKVMDKEPETGAGAFGGSLMGVGTKNYSTVEEARADRGRLYQGDYIDEEEFEGPKKALNERLSVLVEAAAKSYSWEDRDAAREILIDAVRAGKTKAAMDRALKREAQWINYDPVLTDELWKIAEDTRNMKVPYFEAKLRRVVGVYEPLAYIVEDAAEDTDADLLAKMRDMGLNVLTYKAGDREDRLRVLNSVEGSRFQRMDEGDQIMFEDFNPKYAGMHPTLRARQIATDELTGKIRDYFDTVDEDSDAWLSPYDLDELLSYDRLYNTFYDAGTVYLSLLQESAGQGPRKRTGTIYPMMEGLLQRMPDGGERVLNMSEFLPIDSAVSMGEAAEAFRAWYNKRHPSLYYEGYQPGDLFDASHADVDWYEDDRITPEEDKINPSNTQKERDHLRSLLKGGKLMEPELSQAREMLRRLENPTKGEIFYQSMDEGYDDTAEEGKFREESWENLEAMEAINEEIGETVTQLTRGQKKSLGAILDRLRIGLAPEARRKFTEQKARAWIRDYGSTVPLERVVGNLEYLYNYVLRTENPSTAAINEMAQGIAQDIVENALVPIAEDEREDVQQAKRMISGAKLVIDARDASNIGGVESLREFNRRHVGKFSVAQKGGRADTADRVSVDTFYEQLRNSEGIGHLFPEANNPGEMLENIAAIYEMSDERLENPFQFHMGEVITELATEISRSAWWDSVPLEQLTQLEQKKVNNAKIEDRINALQQTKKLTKKDADALRKVLTETETLTERNLEMEDQIRRLTEEKALSEADAAQLRAELQEAENDNLSRTKLLAEQIKKLKEEKALGEAEANKLYNEVSKLTSKLDSAQRRYDRLKEKADDRLAQTKIEGRARTEERVAKERAKAAEKIADLKEHYQEMQRNARERREESGNVKKYREQVTKKAKKLYEMLMKNDDKMHVPEVLKKPLADFLTELDFTSKRGLRGGDATRNDMAFGAKLQRLQQLLQNQQSYIDGDSNVEGDLGGYIDVSQDSLDFLRNTAELIAQAMAGGRTYTINDMNGADLKQLANLLSNLYTAIRNMNTFMANARYESIREAADGDIQYMQELGKAGKLANAAGVRFAGWENGTPYYIMKRFGEGGRSLFDGFARGWEKMAFNAQEIINFTEKLYTDKEVNDWDTHVNDFELSDGSKIQMTTAQIMELSMLLGRGQAVQHIERGGVRIGDIKLKQGEVHDTTHYHLTAEDIIKITGVLTERQRTVARAMQQFMAHRGADWGNEISMRRFGYKFYTEGEGYYPIKTDSNDRPMSDTDDPTNSMFRLLNLSSSKALNPKASNALVVNSIFDTFADHMADMAKLNGMGLPILDAIKWFNYKERIDLGNGEYDTRTLQGTMEQAFGKSAQNYFRTLMKDINGVTESGDRGTSLPGKLMSNYKIAAVGANLRVALLQPTSYVRALTVLKPQYLAGVAPSRAAYREAMQYSGTAVWKALGYYDTDISKGMRGQIKHDDTLRDKIAEASMKAAELGDQLTWSRLWTACKRQAKGENKSLSGDALMQAAADLFRDVVYSSQVMDSTLTRSQIMRGRTNWTKAMSAFMAEPTLSYNILLDAASQYHLDARQHGKAGAWQRNAGVIGKAFSVYVCSAAFSAVVESIADAARDDDDEEYLDKVLQALLGEKGLLSGNLAQDLTILGKLPYIKNFISNLQGFKSNDMSTAAFDNLLSVYQIWEETLKLQTGALEKPTKVTYYGKMTDWGKVYKTLQALSQLTGVAAANMTRDVTAIWNTIMNGRRDEWKIRTYDGNQLTDEQGAGYEEYVQSLGITKGQYKKILDAADVDGSVKPTQAEMGEYLTQAIEAGELTEEQAQGLWKSQWNKEKSTTLDKWREKNAGQPAAATTSTTTSTTVKTTTTQAAPQQGGYDAFKKDAPLYGEKRDSTYAAYQNSLSGTMTLDEFTQMLKQADADSNGSLKQDELGYMLRAAVNNRAMSWAQAAEIWNAQGWKRDFDYWASRH